MISPYRGKLFRLKFGAVLFQERTGWWSNKPADLYTVNSDYCFGLEEEVHVAEKPSKDFPSIPAMDLVEVLIGQKVWWVKRDQIVV